MSGERPSNSNRIDKITRSFKGKLSSLLHVSRPPAPSSIDVDSSSDSYITTDARTRNWPLKMIPTVSVNHAPATAVARTEARGISPPILVPVSASVFAVPRQPGKPRLETTPTHVSPETHGPISPPLPDAIMQANLGSMGLEQNRLTQHHDSGFFANAQNFIIAGGTFNNNILPANTGKMQMKISVPQKPNSSPFFTGRKDVLNKLGKIFIHHANSRLMSRCSCLLWGMGGIGKTQICLKFTEEMSDSFSHVFWVDASSHESITMSFKGISSIPAQASGVDGSIESVLQWISCIQEEWLIVFDNADGPPEVVAKFVPPGNRGNILITS